jgi:hypothetical protein
MKEELRLKNQEQILIENLENLTSVAGKKVVSSYIATIKDICKEQKIKFDSNILVAMLPILQSVEHNIFNLLLQTVRSNNQLDENKGLTVDDSYQD